MCKKYQCLLYTFFVTGTIANDNKGGHLKVDQWVGVVKFFRLMVFNFNKGVKLDIMCVCNRRK